jgi:hypothetical protein
LYTTGISIAVILSVIAQFVLLKLLTLPSGIAELVEIRKSGFADALVRLCGVNANGIGMTGVEFGSLAFIHQLLANQAGSILRIRREVDEAGFTPTDISFGCVRADGIRGTVVGAFCAFVLFTDAKSSRTPNRVRAVVKVPCLADTNVTFVRINTLGGRIAIVCAFETFILEANLRDRVTLLTAHALASVITSRGMKQAALSLAYITWEFLGGVTGTRHHTLARTRIAFKSGHALALMFSIVCLAKALLIGSTFIASIGTIGVE